MNHVERAAVSGPGVEEAPFSELLLPRPSGLRPEAPSENPTAPWSAVCKALPRIPGRRNTGAAVLPAEGIRIVDHCPGSDMSKPWEAESDSLSQRNE